MKITSRQQRLRSSRPQLGTKAATQALAKDSKKRTHLCITIRWSGPRVADAASTGPVAGRAGWSAC